jgi:hypothetical protein
VKDEVEADKFWSGINAQLLIPLYMVNIGAAAATALAAMQEGWFWKYRPTLATPYNGHRCYI